MKAFILSLVLVCANTYFVQGQKLEVEEIEIKLTKAGKKALKKQSSGKAEFTNFGRYTNADTSEFYTVYLHRYKDEPMQYEIHTVNENAENAEVKTGQFTPGFLKAYGVEEVEEDAIDRVPEVSNDQYAYLKRRALALKGPEVRIGHFELEYYEGVWKGFGFEVDEEYDLEEIFWPDVKVPVVEGGLSNNNYLVAARGTLGKLLEGDRTYLPASGKILAAGPLAVSEQNQYLYGIYNFNSRSWEKKQTYTFDEKISGVLAQITTDNGVTTMLQKGEQPHLIHFTNQGEIAWQKSLAVDEMKKYSGWTFILTPDGKTMLYASKLVSSAFNPKFGLQTYLLENGEIARQNFYDYDEFDEKLIEAPKSDIKLKQVSGFAIREIRKATNGDLLYVEGSSMAGGKGGEAIVQLDPENGELKHLYITDAVPHVATGSKGGPEGGYQPPILKEVEPGVYYWIVRNTPESRTLGVHQSSSSEDLGNIRRITTTTYRVDDIQTRFNVHKINLNTGEVSRAFEGEEYIMYGDDPVFLTNNGKLYIPCLEGSDYYNLLIE
ncbi:MAG: hypothetical protein U5L96_09285 [Owenweeksia sp.]|nr:hypothetical protein [Owenweeksia sp.]